jgi:internalin A
MCDGHFCASLSFRLLCSLDGNAIESDGASAVLEAVAVHCPAIQRVDLSSCGIAQLAIPLTLCHRDGVQLILDDNPILSPPPEVVARGWDAIRSFTMEVNSSSVPLSRLKLLLVGDGSAGKSSVVAVVKAAARVDSLASTAEARLRVQLPQAGDSGRTMGVEQCTVPMRSSASDRELVMTMVDVAGQHESYPTHVFFMSHRSVVALVVDISWRQKDEAARLDLAMRCAWIAA